MASSNETQNPKGPTARRLASIPSWAHPIIIFCNTIYPFCLWLSGLCLVVLLGMLFLGHTAVSDPWLAQALMVFTFGGAIGFLSILIAEYESFTPGWIALIIGVTLYYGSSFAIPAIVGSKPLKGDEVEFVKAFTLQVQNIGIALLAMSIIRLMIGYYKKFTEDRARALAMRKKFMDAGKQKVVKTAADSISIVPKCWQMSRCRPGVRNSCPNYTDKVTCWKRRSGCFCDRDLANYLMSAVDRGSANEVIEMQIAAGSNATEKSIQQNKTRTAPRRPWRQQKTLCHACPLYVEHQEYKYKHFHWLSGPLTVAILVFGYQYFDLGYKGLANFLDAFAKELVKRGGLPENFTPSSGALVNSPFEYVLLAAVGLILGSYMVGLIDKVFLEWKI